MKLSISSIFITFLLMASNSYAGWSEPGEINRLRVFGGDILFSSLSSLSASDTQAACGVTGNAGQFGVRLNELYSKYLVSMILSAEMAGRSVKVFMTGNCVQGRPEVNGVQIVDV